MKIIILIIIVVIILLCIFLIPNKSEFLNTYGIPKSLNDIANIRNMTVQNNEPSSEEPSSEEPSSEENDQEDMDKLIRLYENKEKNITFPKMMLKSDKIQEKETKNTTMLDTMENLTEYFV